MSKESSKQKTAISIESGLEQIIVERCVIQCLTCPGDPSATGCLGVRHHRKNCVRVKSLGSISRKLQGYWVLGSSVSVDQIRQYNTERYFSSSCETALLLWTSSSSLGLSCNQRADTDRSSKKKWNHPCYQYTEEQLSVLIVFSRLWRSYSLKNFYFHFDIQRNCRGKNIAILKDSQAAIKGLRFNQRNSKLVWECLNRLSNYTIRSGYFGFHTILS